MTGIVRIYPFENSDFTKCHAYFRENEYVK